MCCLEEGKRWRTGGTRGGQEPRNIAIRLSSSCECSRQGRRGQRRRGGSTRCEADRFFRVLVAAALPERSASSTSILITSSGTSQPVSLSMRSTAARFVLCSVSASPSLSNQLLTVLPFPLLQEISSSTPNDNWTQILPRSKVEPHKENFFVVDASSEGKVFNYVRMTVYPGASTFLMSLRSS